MSEANGLARVAAWGAVAVAVAVLLGWFTGQAWLVQGGGGRVPMPFNAALGLLLSAAAMLLGRRHGGWRLLWPLLPVLVLAGAALIQETWRLDLGIDRILFRQDILAEAALPGPRASGTALALLLGAAALIWNAIARDTPESRLGLFTAGVFIVLIAVIAAATTPISLPVTLGLMLHGLALVAGGSGGFLTLRPKAEAAVAVVAALSVAVALLLWSGLSRQQERAVARQVLAGLNHLADNIRIRADERALLFQRAAERLARREPAVQEQEFRLEAEALAADIPGLRAIGWVKPNGWIRWLAGATATDTAAAGRFDGDPVRRQLLADVAAARTLKLSAPAELRVRGAGAVLAAPLIAEGSLVGYLVAGLPYAEFFDAVIGQEAPRYSIEVRDGETVAFRRELEPGTPARDAQRLGLDLLGRSFTVEIRPAPALLAQLRSPLPQVVLASSLISGCLLSLAVGLVALARRRADAADAASRTLRLYQRALDASASGVLICDAHAGDLPIVHVNQAFERITGYAAEEVVGRNCRFLQGEDRDQPGLDRLRRALAEHTECQLELRNYRKDGSLFWNELRLAPVRDESGRVTHFIGIQHDITERKHEQARLEHLASHDELTGLPNRRALYKLLRKAPGRIGVILLNLDRLHQVNDTLGHETGDKVLVEVAGRLRALARNAGCDLGRIAGDEFLLLVPATGPAEQVESLAQAAIHALDHPMQIGPHSIHLTCCAGVRIAEGDPKHPERLLGEADLAMNQAKRLGSGQFAVFSDTLAATAGDRLALGVQLREAWDHGEFQLHYQPLIDSAGLGIAGVEALLRWDSPILGPVPPSRFIPVAEDTGLILRLGQYALRTALAQVGAWRRAGLRPVPVSVNVSLLQFQRPEFFEEVSAALAEAGVAPGLLKLEITESMLMTQAAATLAVLERFKALGVGIVLDDFGTGYSSLARLRELPLDGIKIDRVFVEDVMDDPYSAALCRTVIGLCRHYGLEVVAEGVEAPAQARLLAEAGCHVLQGYLFSRPLPARMLGELVARDARWRLDGTLRGRA